MPEYWKTKRKELGGLGPSDPLIEHWDYFVKVCGFTFKAENLDQIREMIEYYSKKTHPTSRRPDPGEIDTIVRDKGLPRSTVIEQYRNEMRWHPECAQRWFEKVPKHLEGEKYRHRVVKALTEAVEYFESESRSK